MKKIINRILCTYFYIKGKRFLEIHKAYESLEFFLKAKKFCGNDLHLYIYLALAEFLTKDFDNALIHFQRSLLILENDTKLNNDEKLYVKSYILTQILDLERIFKWNRSFDDYRNLLRNISYDKNKINNNLFYDFPLGKA